MGAKLRPLRASFCCDDKASGTRKKKKVVVSCEDCGKPYDEFPLDVVLSNSQWELITGHRDGQGILCANCIIERGARVKHFTVAKLVFE